jgi:hypothetical protein
MVGDGVEHFEVGKSSYVLWQFFDHIATDVENFEALHMGKDIGW